MKDVGGITCKSVLLLNHARMLFRNYEGAKTSCVNERTPVIDVGGRLRKSVSVLNHAKILLKIIEAGKSKPC